MGTSCGGRGSGRADCDRVLRDGDAGTRNRYAAHDRLRQPTGAQLGDVRPERGVRRAHHEQRDRGSQERHLPQPDPHDDRQRAAAAGGVPELELRRAGHCDGVRVQRRRQARHESDGHGDGRLEDALGRLLSGWPDRGELLLTSASWGTSLRSYPMGPVATELLSGNDPSRAATYALSACTDPSAPTLATDQNVSSRQPARDERLRAEPAPQRWAGHRDPGAAEVRVGPGHRAGSFRHLHSGAAHRVRSGTVRVLPGSRRSPSSSTTRPFRIRSTSCTTTASSSRRDPATTHMSFTSRSSPIRASRPSSCSRRGTDSGPSASERGDRRRQLAHSDCRDSMVGGG